MWCPDLLHDHALMPFSCHSLATSNDTTIESAGHANDEFSLFGCFFHAATTIFGWPRARAHAGEAALSQCAQLIKELSYIFWCEKQQQQHCRALAIKRSSDALTIISDVIKVKAIQCFPTGDFSYFRGIIIAMPMNQSTAQIL